MDEIQARTGRIGIVILAAGESIRMGTPKQLLTYAGKTLLRRAIDIALELPDAPVVVVLGSNSEQISRELNGLSVELAISSDWRDGMGHSLRAGLSALLTTHPQVAAALFLLCDQPHITIDLVRRLESEWRNGAMMAACRYETRCGVPAIFDASVFSDLLALQGGEGARQILATRMHEVIEIPFPSGAVDVDTPEDYAALLEMQNESQGL